MSVQGESANERSERSGVSERVPKPVYSATSFESMIDWNSEQICPPPYVRDYSEEQIRQFELESCDKVGKVRISAGISK